MLYNSQCCENNVEFGAWLSLVEHLAWDQGVAGSNPAAPTIKKIRAVAFDVFHQSGSLFLCILIFYAKSVVLRDGVLIFCTKKDCRLIY